MVLIDATCTVLFEPVIYAGVENGVGKMYIKHCSTRRSNETLKQVAWCILVRFLILIATHPTLSIIPNRRMDGRFPRLLYRRQGDFFPGSVVSVTILPATMDGQQMGDRISSPHLGPDRQTNIEIFCNRLLTQMCMPEVDKSPCAGCACMAFRTICHICSILQCAISLLFLSCRLRQL